MHRHTVARNLAKQAFALRSRFPGAAIDLRFDELRWTGSLTPTPLSRTYLVQLSYRPGQTPRVEVLRPTLETRLAESLPHVYAGDVLCLHRHGEWSPTMLLADTIVPWTAEWLFFYEIWKETGDWHGGGEWPPAEASDSSPRMVAEQEEDIDMAYDGLLIDA